ncbi:hypothetical protein IOQ59_12360 [Pontibacterium sp. N1Y112]|uniref:Uncharacterized protein n=1 Tax=Pontibacterium sinense TaxID=2781979 RepID=A0A8J7FPY0_9GAMM|nr:hypothetical protein [Pontibacterium sinense]MBE9398052.1 hypothetical protein [Pontibacterium sinense]
MEFIAIFLVTLLIVGGLAVALVFGRAPTYRPSRQDTLQLLKDVASNQGNEGAWQLFLGMPIPHDPDLEEIRQLCVAVDEGDDEHPPATPGLNIYGRDGRERIGKVAEKLEILIAKEPSYKEF